MSTPEAHIKTINHKLQELIKKFLALQKENGNLHKEVSDLREKEKEYDLKIEALDQKINILKAASGEMTEGDKRGFEKRINQYIKEIDRCIGMLSD